MASAWRGQGWRGALARVVRIQAASAAFVTGLGDKIGYRTCQREDAVQWWWDGKLYAVLHRCKREARAMARVAIAAEARLPGGQATRDASIRATVLSGQKRGAAEGARGRAVRQRGDAHISGGGRRPQRSPSPQTADGSQIIGSQPAKRQRTAVHTYDEVKRRGTRKRKVAYLANDGQRASATRDSIVAGAATLDRTVGRRYGWRDGGLGGAKRQRGAREGA